MRLLFLTAALVHAQGTMFFGGSFKASIAPAFVSQCVAPASTGSSATVACSTTMNLTAGNTLAVWVRGGTPTNTVSTVCDGTGSGGCTGTDTFTSITGCSQAANGFGQWWYAKNISVQATATITVTFGSADTYRGMWAGQFSQLSTSAPLDQGPACNAATAATTATTASFTTAHANEVILVAANVADSSGDLAYTAGSGYTLGTAAVSKDLQVEYKFVSITQTGVTGAMTYTPSNDNYASALTLTQ